MIEVYPRKTRSEYSTSERHQLNRINKCLHTEIATYPYAEVNCHIWTPMP